MPPKFQEFSAGLTLKSVTYAEVNADRKSYKGLKKWPVNLDVPKSTKFVHAAVTCVEITPGTTEAPAPSALGRLGFEITERDDSKLSEGKFSCEFRAVFDGAAGSTEWTGYFVLEVLCFG